MTVASTDSAPPTSGDLLLPREGYRLAALRRSRLLDTLPEAAFDRLTALAQRLLGVPIALVSLVDRDRQFFKSQTGLLEPLASARETPLSHSFCQHVTASDAPLVVPDARLHPLVCDNPAVHELGAVAYLGVPIHSPDGYALGSLCAVDVVPRAWTDSDQATLLDLAAMAESEIALRAELSAHARTEAQYRALFEASPDAVLVLDPETEAILDANGSACALYGRTREDLVGSTMKHASVDPSVGEAAVARMAAEGGAARLESVHRRADGTAFDVAISASVVQLGGRSVVMSVNRDVTEWNRVGRALRDSEERFRLLADTATDVIVSIDTAGTIQYTNRAVEGIFGYAPAELAGRPLGALMPADLRARHDAGIARFAETGQRTLPWSQVEMRGLRKDGTEFPISISFGEYVADSKRFFTGIIRDTTAQKAAEEALRRRDAHYRQMADALPQLVWTAKPDGTHDFFNGRWHAYTGMTPGDTEWQWKDYAHPDDWAASVAQWRLSLVTGEPYEMEYRIRRASDGAYRWFIGRAEPVRNEAGEIVRWFGTSTDIHDLREAREQLRTQGEQLRLVHRATTDVVRDLDAASGVLAWGPAVVDVLGWEEAVAGTDLAWWEDRVHPDDRAHAVASFTGAAEGTGTLWQEEYRFRRADGTYAFVLDRGYLVRDDGGNVVRVVGAMVDLSERKAVEMELVAAREVAEAAARLKSSLLANMSHEIRTPLTAILGFAEVLAAEVPPDLREYAEVIERGGQRLLSTLNSVLDLAQIEAGEFRIASEPVDLLAEAEAVCAVLRPLALAKGLEIRVVGPSVRAFADRAAVGRVLNNLIGNAVKFTDRGSVTVEIGGPGESACLSVADTGVGIAPVFLPHLFTEFKQESEGDSRTHEGNGLGLAITRRLVGLMGGEIAVESELGAGSAFAVRLPRAEEHAVAA